MTDTLTEADKIVEEMKSPGRFNLQDVLSKKVTYPTGTQTVFTDGETAQKLLEVTEELVDQRNLYETLTAQSHGITEEPDAAAAADRIAALTVKQAELLEAVKASRLTFHLRGLAPKQWRLIDQSWRKEIPAPARESFGKGGEGTEAFQLEELERNIKRNEKVNEEILAKAIVKVVNADGDEDPSGWTTDAAGQLHDFLLETEWSKLIDKAQKLTFANSIFENLVNTDADFLPPS